MLLKDTGLRPRDAMKLKQNAAVFISQLVFCCSNLEKTMFQSLDKLLVHQDHRIHVDI